MSHTGITASTIAATAIGGTERGTTKSYGYGGYRGYRDYSYEDYREHRFTNRLNRDEAERARDYNDEY
jgi:hypothetical protein